MKALQLLCICCLAIVPVHSMAQNNDVTYTAFEYHNKYIDSATKQWTSRYEIVRSLSISIMRSQKKIIVLVDKVHTVEYSYTGMKETNVNGWNRTSFDCKDKVGKPVTVTMLATKKMVQSIAFHYLQDKAIMEVNQVYPADVKPTDEFLQYMSATITTQYRDRSDFQWKNLVEPRKDSTIQIRVYTGNNSRIEFTTMKTNYRQTFWVEGSAQPSVDGKGIITSDYNLTTFFDREKRYLQHRRQNGVWPQYMFITTFTDREMYEVLPYQTDTLLLLGEKVTQYHVLKATKSNVGPDENWPITDLEAPSAILKAYRKDWAFTRFVWLDYYGKEQTYIVEEVYRNEDGYLAMLVKDSNGNYWDIILEYLQDRCCNDDGSFKGIQSIKAAFTDKDDQTTTYILLPDLTKRSTR